MDSESTLNVHVWSEGTEIGDTYPNGINAAVAAALNDSGRVIARTATIEDEAQGVSEADLDWADVVVWWGHLRHDDVEDETVDRIVDAVRSDGLGFIALHSAHYARPFTTLLEQSGDLGDVRTIEGETERLVVEAPDHPIAAGIDDFALPQVEMFGEPFDVPEPDTVVFRSDFSEGGEFRSGSCWAVGDGRVFYFRPGHETFRIYHDQNVKQVLSNAVRWAADAV
jgi:trehalose utilization protein